MKRLGLFLLAFVLLGGALAVASPRSSAGQDNTDERIATLEARVAALEARVAELEAGNVDSSPVDPTATHDLTVRLLISGQVDTAIAVQGGEVAEARTCSGLGSLSDIDEGASVVVRDVHDKVIGRSSLGSGSWDPYEVGGSYGSCTFDVPVIQITESQFYTVAIGDHMGVSFSLEEMMASGWSVFVSTTDLK